MSLTETIQKDNASRAVKLHGIDHLRALAIIIVFLFHYQSIFANPSWFPKFFRFGRTGVDLFFVLSGFLIASQLFERIKQNGGFSLKEFYLKRFFRIIPVYLVVVAIYFCFPFFREKEGLPPLWKFLTFTQNLGIDLKNGGTFSHAWSLCVEEHFYLFFPLVLLFFLRYGIKNTYKAIIVLLVAGFLIRLYCWNTFVASHINEPSLLTYWLTYIYYPTYCRLDGLLIGILIAAFYQYLPSRFDRISKYGNYFILLGILILGGFHLSFPTSDTFSYTMIGFPLIAIGYGFMVIGAISPASFLYKWHSKSSTEIAALSYAIYLSHKGIIHMSQAEFSRLNIDKDSNLMVVICMIMCLLGAWILNRTIEKPFMQWGIKLKTQLEFTSASLLKIDQ